MADYGMQVWDGNGELIIDSTMLINTHRVILAEVVTSSGNLMFPEPLDEEPSVIVMGIVEGFGGTSYPARWQHITSGGKYTGIDVIFSGVIGPSSIFMAFAQR